MASVFATVPHGLFASIVGGFLGLGLLAFASIYYRVQFKALIELAHVRLKTGFHEEDDRHRRFALKMLGLGIVQSVFIAIGSMIAGAIATPITGLLLLAFFFGWPFRKLRKEAGYQFAPEDTGIGAGLGGIAWALAFCTGVVWGIATWLEKS